MLNNADNQLVVDLELIRRLDKNGPRYTSYPTADRFVEAFNAETYSHWVLKREIRRYGAPLVVVYPYSVLQTRCVFLLCLQQSHHQGSQQIAEYVRYLNQGNGDAGEAAGAGQVVEQLHFGGGTPNFYGLTMKYAR